MMTANAAASINKPEECPDLNIIHSVGMDTFRQIGNNLWMASRDHLFNTPFKWHFSIGKFNVKNQEEVKEQADSAISTLEPQYSDKPVLVYPSADPLWVCFYYHDDLIAMAETPSN